MINNRKIKKESMYLKNSFTALFLRAILSIIESFLFLRSSHFTIKDKSLANFYEHFFYAFSWLSWQKVSRKIYSLNEWGYLSVRYLWSQIWFIAYDNNKNIIVCIGLNLLKPELLYLLEWTWICDIIDDDYGLRVWIKIIILL